MDLTLLAGPPGGTKGTAATLPEAQLPPGETETQRALQEVPPDFLTQEGEAPGSAGGC